MSDGNSKKRIIPPFVPSNPDQTIFQLQLLADLDSVGQLYCF